MLSNKRKFSINISFLHDDPRPLLLLYFSPFLIFYFLPTWFHSGKSNMLVLWQMLLASRRYGHFFFLLVGTSAHRKQSQRDNGSPLRMTMHLSSVFSSMLLYVVVSNQETWFVILVSDQKFKILDTFNHTSASFTLCHGYALTVLVSLMPKMLVPHKSNRCILVSSDQTVVSHYSLGFFSWFVVSSCSCVRWNIANPCAEFDLHGSLLSSVRLCKYCIFQGVIVGGQLLLNGTMTASRLPGSESKTKKVWVFPGHLHTCP